MCHDIRRQDRGREVGQQRQSRRILMGVVGCQAPRLLISIKRIAEVQGGRVQVPAS